MGTPPALTPAERRARAAGIGCFMTFTGFFSMAMVGVLVSVAVAWLTRAPRCPDIPSCNWYVYAGFGGLFGAITLPLLVLRRLRSTDPRPPTSNPRSF
jgi:hypothetical protein